jgi:hypothetical protein
MGKKVQRPRGPTAREVHFPQLGKDLDAGRLTTLHDLFPAVRRVLFSTREMMLRHIRAGHLRGWITHDAHMDQADHLTILDELLQYWVLPAGVRAGYRAESVQEVVDLIMRLVMQAVYLRDDEDEYGIPVDGLLQPMDPDNLPQVEKIFLLLFSCVMANLEELELMAHCSAQQALFARNGPETPAAASQTPQPPCDLGPLEQQIWDLLLEQGPMQGYPISKHVKRTYDYVRCRLGDMKNREILRRTKKGYEAVVKRPRRR